jgi:hypothetical protein
MLNTPHTLRTVKFILVQIGDEQDIIKAIYLCIGLLFELLLIL